MGKSIKSVSEKKHAGRGENKHILLIIRRERFTQLKHQKHFSHILQEEVDCTL
jgi:hypothetical protein